ncbi:hypothetical protein TNCV_315491 [Trichonephila clavipes]|nr:hypothetical protein TNCV_315491 [Trichonephila clavipes]
MKTSSVEFISRSPTPSPMERKHRRFVFSDESFNLGSLSEGKEKSFRTDVQNSTEENIDAFSSGLHGNTAADSVRSEWPLWHAAKSNAVSARRRIEWKLELKLSN